MASMEQKSEKAVPTTVPRDTEIEQGRLDELEIDLGNVLKEEGEIDPESDRSPYPEGTVPDI